MEIPAEDVANRSISKGAKQKQFHGAERSKKGLQDL